MRKLYPKTCPICHRSFRARKSQRFCGHTCATHSQKGYIKILTKVCPGCSKEYKTEIPHQKYCSHSCSSTSRGGIIPDHLRGQYRTLKAVLRHMVSRCTNPLDKCFYRYGGRGITICLEWRTSKNLFCEWALSNGYQKGLTVERKDNNGPYSPANCKIATYSEQSRNKRTTIHITAWGETKCLKDWAYDPRSNFGPNGIKHRIKMGLSPEDSIGGKRKRSS